MKLFCFLLLLINIRVIYSEPIWNISFYDIEDLNNSNSFNINKGTYKTIIVNITNKGNNDDTHFNATLKLNHPELKMFPDELKINSENQIYNIELGIRCGIDLESITFDFNLESDDDTNIKDLIEINTCTAHILSENNKIVFSILNKDGLRNNFYGKAYIKQDHKNFENIKVQFSTSTDKMCTYKHYLENIEDITINNYNGNSVIYYSYIKPNIEELKKGGVESFNCKISAMIISQENQNCFYIENENIVTVKYQKEEIEYDSNGNFVHNSIVSSYIDKNREYNNSLSLFFFKEVSYFVSYCAIQDLNSIFLSNNEILNQSLYYENRNKNINLSFAMNEFTSNVNISEIIFKDLDENKNYKIKCIYDFFDNKSNLEITYGKGMQIPMEINFNSTKSILGKNCHVINTKLDTRKCDIINHRLVFKQFYDKGLKYLLTDFNYESFNSYIQKDTSEKIEYMKEIINKNISLVSKENELISMLSDFLFLIDCQENKGCQNEKNVLFKKILIKYGEINVTNIDINDRQLVLNDILLFNNIIENTDCINYDNFEFMINDILNKRRIFFSSSTQRHNQILANYFLLIFDKFISYVTTFKSIYSDKLELDEKINIYKNKILINFYSLFIGWISNGMINSEDKLISFCQNLIVNYSETPVNSKVQTIIDTNTVKITGFDNEQSQKLYRNIYSAGAISYKNFPFFPLKNNTLKVSQELEAVSILLYTELRDNFINTDISYSEAFKVIFKKRDINNFCYLFDNDYINNNSEIINNYVSTEYLDKDDDDKYNINCISRVMISPMTVILGKTDINGSLFIEGINICSLIVIILITLCLIVISLPFLLQKFYKNQSKKTSQTLNEIN